MIDKIVKEYINHLSYKDVLLFASKNNITISDNEAKIICKYIVNNWYTLIHGDTTNIFNNLKQEVSQNTYVKCQQLFKEYYLKYKNYL